MPLIVFLLLCGGGAAQVAPLSQRLETARHFKQHGAMQSASNAYEALLPQLRSAADSALLAPALFESSEVEIALGSYQRAAERAAEAARVFRQRGNGSEEARAINNVGRAYLYQGDYSTALQSFQRALALHRVNRNPEGEVTLGNNIGNVYFFRGQYLNSLQSYENALKRVDETSGEAWRPHRRGLTLTNLATLYEALGQNDRALDYFLQARAVSWASPPSEQAQLLSNLGTLYRRLGTPAKALETYGEAEHLFSREHHSDGEIHIQENIGIALAVDYGDLNGALHAFRKALQLADATGNNRQSVLAHLFGGEALNRMGRLDDAQREFETALSGARQLGAAEEEWTALYDLGVTHNKRGDRGPALRFFGDAIGVIESVRSGLGASSLKAEFLANKRDVYDARIDLLLQSGAPPGPLFTLMEQGRSRNLKDALQNGIAPPSLSAVQSRLGEGSMMIEYWVGRQKMAALWITRGRAGIVSGPVTPGIAVDIKNLAESLPEAAGPPDHNRTRRLGELLFAGVPLEDSVRHVLIVPDGMLHNLPFEVLEPTASGGALIERYAVSYLPSAALLLKNYAKPSNTPPWKREMVAFGDPSVSTSRAPGADARWSALPASSKELGWIASALRGRAEVHAGADDLKRYLTDGRATGVPLLHFSTHAVADAEDPNRSRVLFSPEKNSAGSEYLFWREVLRLPLSGVELVTLSACDTEGGKLTRGEGVQNFSRAFMLAGADATVTALWRVADWQTAEFMKRFYGRLARGETKAAALRDAKLSFLHSGSELALPRYWAAFVLTGDGQRPIRRVWSWGWLVLPSVTLAVTICGLFCFLALARNPGDSRTSATAESCRGTVP